MDSGPDEAGSDEPKVARVSNSLESVKPAARDGEERFERFYFYHHLLARDVCMFL
jgi:hypothetical protein